MTPENAGVDASITRYVKPYAYLLLPPSAFLPALPICRPDRIG